MNQQVLLNLQYARRMCIPNLEEDLVGSLSMCGISLQDLDRCRVSMFVVGMHAPSLRVLKPWMDLEKWEF